MIQNDFDIKTQETESGLPALPPGSPLFTIVVDVLPSWNDIISENNPIDRSKIIKRERERGYRVGIALAKSFNIKLKTVKVRAKTLRDSYRDVLIHPLTEKKLFCLVKVWRARSIKDRDKGNRRRDVYNVAAKAIIDGLTDAGIWMDDNEEIHTDFWVTYVGVADAPKIEISIFEK